MTRTEREIREIAEWADEHDVHDEREIVDVLIAADLEPEDVDEVQRHRTHGAS